ncbi:MAG: PQQ-dependent sugar dehydrogenase [Bacteroidetes bacterium]|nr:PQQ-dependent sugar dehydrogenase [Bacteroidota bacterium]
MPVILYILLLASIFSCNSGDSLHETGDTSTFPKSKIEKNSGLLLPEGFTATIIADHIGHARHLAIAPNGNIYIKLLTPKDGNGIIFLQKTETENVYVTKGFGNYGGTGIAIKDGYLYASSDEAVYRYALNKDFEVVNPAKPEKIITGLESRNQHSSKSITLDDSGHIYVNIGAYSNACQEDDRMKGSKGLNPCPILERAGGIWQFKVNQLNQSYQQGIRYATGLRNVVGLDWNHHLNKLFVMQHGRDQLHDLFPQIFTEKQSAELPAECLYTITPGVDCGWPYMYYDGVNHKKMLSPEYGGDGQKEGGKSAIDPTASYPAHMAPNGLLFYTGNQFPEKYLQGAFIAFHGSWNRAPLPQKGFLVAFQPFKGEKAMPAWEIFADHFAGEKEVKNSNDALHRPCGLAQGQDGSLYVSDDVQGTIYKITYANK